MESPPINPRKRKLASESDREMFVNNWKYRSDRPGANVTAAVDKLFSKHYEVKKGDNFRLPAPESTFKDLPWHIDELQRLKRDLNRTKSQLNDFNLMEWQSHTRKRNQAGDVQWRLRRDVNPEFLTQAWSKFYENASSFPLVPRESLEAGELNSVHLCEAPGAFITSLNHWLRLNASEISWNWLATTLNPHYEGNSLSTMINDDRFILHTADHWFFGADNTGDLMKLDNLDQLVQRAEKIGDIMLVTADGSINCLDMPDEQESVVVHLHYCEVVAALHLLSPGGSLLLKVFTIFEHQTVSLVFLLSCCFERIVLNKPATSKEGNSEVYVVCLGFRGRKYVEPYLQVLRDHYERDTEVAMFRRCDVPESFVRQIFLAGEFFKAHQCEVIENNIMSFHAMVEDREVRRIRKAVADHFVKKYKVRRLEEEEVEIVGKAKLGLFGCEIMGSKFSEDSYNGRKKKVDLLPLQKLQIIQEEMEKIHVGEDAFVFKFVSDPEQLQITFGKLYDRIQSSRFCTPKFLKNFNSVFDIDNELELSSQASQNKIREFIVKSKEGNNVYCFEYSPKMDFSIVEKLHEIMQSTEEDQTITLQGYCLLTQLNIGLLYFLSHAFEALEMQVTPDVGSVITLRCAKKSEKIINIFKQIVEASATARRKNQAVISVLPIATLCASDMYNTILKINQWTVKHVVDRIANQLNKS